MHLAPQARFSFYGSPDNYLTTAAAVLSGRVTEGDHVARLEQRVAQWTGAAHAVAMPQARVGIYAALRSLIRPGQKVILSPYTIYDVVNMVICAGGWPVFADIERDTCNIDAGQVEALIDDETGAVIATHLHGLACDIERIAAACRRRGVAVIEDAAQCFGGRVEGRHIGTFGDVGVFSFGRVKNINAFFGGMAVTNDPGLRDRLAEIQKFPYEDTGRLLKRAAHCLMSDILTSPPVFQMFTFWLFRYGCLHDREAVNKLVQTERHPVLRHRLPEHYRRRLTPLQARLATRQIEEVARHTEKRIDHARRYHAGLSAIPNLGLPPLREDGSHIYLAFPIRVPDRWSVVKHMMREGRDLAVQHYANAADLSCFAAYARDCPNARQTASEVILLPTYPRYAKEEVEKNIEVLRRYFHHATEMGSPAVLQRL